MKSPAGWIAALIIIGAAVFFWSRKGAQDARPGSPSLSETSEVATASPTPSASPALIGAPPSPPPAASATPIAELSPADQKRLKTLDQILSSKNDNDPRLDSEFRQMSPALKAALRDKYAATASENRNQRGTEVFLLGREIHSPDDVAFISGVLNEAPCLSLQDCAKPPPGKVDEHASMANEVTVVYPQLVAVHSLGSYLAHASLDDPGRKAAVDALLFAQRSPQSKIASAAQAELAKLHL